MTEPDRWWLRARCRGMPAELFFAPEGFDKGLPRMNRWSTYYDEARTICGTCRVREPCLAETLTGPAVYDEYGFRGGKSPKERKELRGRWRKANELPRASVFDVSAP